MSIEKKLKQSKPFISDYIRLAVSLQLNGTILESNANKSLRPYNISIQQFNILRILKGKYPEGYCVKELTLRMVDKNSNASRLVDKLGDKGLITKSVSSADRREVTVRITNVGLHLIESSSVELEGDIHKTLSQIYSEDEAHQLLELLNRISG